MPKNPKDKKTSTAARATTWCFTLNNPTAEEIQTIQTLKTRKTVYGNEVGESGTPHLQGYIRFTRQYRLAALKKLIKRAHWETAKTEDAENYCLKDGDFWIKETPKETAKPKWPVKTIQKLRPWQQEVWDLTETEPDDRSIYWYYDDGNNGKTQLCKKLVYEKDACLTDGKGKDIYYAIAQYIEDRKKPPKIVLVDIPRDYSERIDYGALEKIKDGLFRSTKYEGTTVVMDPPHIIIFSNYKCPEGIYTKDRLKQRCLEQKDTESLTANDKTLPKK